MFASKIVLICLLIPAALGAVGPTIPQCVKSCQLQFRCASHVTDPPVYAIENNVCRLFISMCHFSANNCRRQNLCQTLLQTTTEAKCAEKCPQACAHSINDQDLCASFPYIGPLGTNEFNTLYFANQCELSKYACENNIAYLSVVEPLSNGVCPF